MSSIRKYILEQVARRALSQEEAKQLLTELAAAAAPSAREEEIAIVGMAGRFPIARNAEEFWDVLKRGINCIRDYPESRRKDFEHILRNPHYTEFLTGDAIDPQDIPHAHARAGYLDEIDKFDAAFFGLPPAEATYMDPYQRMALEIAWEAMEDAGYGGKRLFGTNTGVFIGKEGTNYSLYRYCSVKDPMQLTGSWESIMASRISYLFDFRGPCMVVDTACSAGLVSIHMAAQALLTGECDLAIAGGINLSITGEFNTRFQGGMKMDAVESQDGVIRTFDGRANGTVWGEGAALVVLKPLSRALADRDHIRAVIKGSAINNDGASNGLTAPNAEAQEEVIVKAWRKARIDPAALSYIEAHGTGTVLGDPIEFKGLTGAFRRYTGKRQFCAIGSLKTNMGHLVAASGVASLCKVVKSLEHQQMAPTINFGQPNPYINFVGSPLYVNDTLTPWTSEHGPRFAGISSFGFSHTNCHMVVAEAPARASLPASKAAYCLTLSGQTRAVLLDYVQRLRAFCAGGAWSLADLCYTLNTGRGHYEHRLAIVASAEDELRERLDASVRAMEQGVPSEAVHYGRHQIVSERKKQRDPGELTDKERNELSRRAASELDRFLHGQGDAAPLHELARCYAQGAQIDWDRFYAGEPRNRLALPTYPFQRVRVWAEPKLSKLASAEARLHPLVERLASRSAEEDIYESVFAIDSHWVLSDHRIMGSCVVPGTTYLEMARVAAASSRRWDAIELKDVFFLVPMMVEKGERRRVRIRVQASGATLAFQIESLAGARDAQWVRHVEGRIEPLSATPGERIDIAALQAQADEAVLDYQGRERYRRVPVRSALGRGAVGLADRDAGAGAPGFAAGAAARAGHVPHPPVRAGQRCQPDEPEHGRHVPAVHLQVVPPVPRVHAGDVQPDRSEGPQGRRRSAHLRRDPYRRRRQRARGDPRLRREEGEELRLRQPGRRGGGRVPRRALAADRSTRAGAPGGGPSGCARRRGRSGGRIARGVCRSGRAGPARTPGCGGERGRARQRARRRRGLRGAGGERSSAAMPPASFSLPAARRGKERRISLTPTALPSAGIWAWMPCSG